jgi:hypothetical protein
MGQSLLAKLMIAEAALADVRTAVTRDTSAELRAVRVKLEQYERVLRGFRYRTPGEEQYRSLHECVLELHGEVFGTADGNGERSPQEGGAGGEGFQATHVQGAPLSREKRAPGG